MDASMDSRYINTDNIIKFYEKIEEDRKKIFTAEKPPHNPKSKGYLESKIGNEVPEEGRGFEGLLELHDHLDKVSTQWQHPLFLGYFPSSISEQSIAGQTISELFPNYNSVNNYRQVEADLERKLADQIVDLLKIPEKFKWTKVEYASHRGRRGSRINNGRKWVGHYIAYNEGKKTGR